MFENLSLKSNAFGLDISDFSLKAAKLKKNGKFLNLVSWGEIDIKPGIVEGGEIKDEKAFSQAINDLFFKEMRGRKYKNQDIVVALPEQKAFSQVIQMPIMAREELESAILFESENYIPFPLEEVYLDFQIIPTLGESFNHLDIFIVALPKIIINSYFSCLKIAGFSPKIFEIESQSIVRSIIKNEISERPVLILDFGKNTANLIIYSGRSIRFSSLIPISSSQLTAVISQKLKVNFEEAEKLKLEYGLELDKDKKKKNHPAVSEAIIPTLNELVDQMKKYISFYKTHRSHEHLRSGNEEIEKIVLCGRGANLKGFSDFLSLAIDIPVEFGNPWINILPEPLKDVPGLPFKESLGYATALGLALRGTNTENNSI